jgi:hypothetical protein
MDETTRPPPQQDPQTQDVTGGGRGGRAADPVIRPYDRVITKDATSKTGVFGVHRIKDRLNYEIALGRTTDRATKLHLEDIQTQIAHALDPAIQAAAGATATGRVGTALDDFDVTVAPDACWVDYAIRRKGGS